MHKQKTKSFTHLKADNPKLKSKKASNVSISPQKSDRQSNVEYTQLSRVRFLRKDIDRHEEFDPRIYITNELSYEDVVDLKDVFDTYDSSDMGVMLPNDLKLFLQQNGYNPNKTTVYDILAQFDEGETGGISFKDFMRAMGTKPNQNQSKKQISAVFKKFDRDAKGFIDLEDLREVNKRIKQNIEEETLQLIMSRLKGSKQGKIDFDEFHKIMTQGFTW